MVHATLLPDYPSLPSWCPQAVMITAPTEQREKKRKKESHRFPDIPWRWPSGAVWLQIAGQDMGHDLPSNRPSLHILVIPVHGLSTSDTLTLLFVLTGLPGEMEDTDWQIANP